jgi:hypothetical protein
MVTSLRASGSIPNLTRNSIGMSRQERRGTCPPSWHHRSLARRCSGHIDPSCARLTASPVKPYRLRTGTLRRSSASSAGQVMHCREVIGPRQGSRCHRGSASAPAPERLLSKRPVRVLIAREGETISPARLVPGRFEPASLGPANPLPDRPEHGYQQALHVPRCSALLAD